MKYVTNNTEQSIALIPNYSQRVTVANGGTLQENVYAEYFYTWISSNNYGSNYFKVNGENVAVGQNDRASMGAVDAYITTESFFGFIPKGSKVEWSGGNAKFYKVV